MALRSISRAGMDVAGRAAGKGRAGAVTHRPLVGAERMVSSFVGQGHFGRSQALPYRQGILILGLGPSKGVGLVERALREMGCCLLYALKIFIFTMFSRFFPLGSRMYPPQPTLAAWAGLTISTHKHVANSYSWQYQSSNATAAVSLQLSVPLVTIIG